MTISSSNPTSDDRLVQIIRSHARPLDPNDVDVESRLAPLSGIRAVLFDVYGTLFVSGSGDIGTTDAKGHPAALAAAMSDVGLPPPDDARDVVRLMRETIAAHHARDRRRGVEFPEVDIRDVWTELLGAEKERWPNAAPGGGFDLTALALLYEMRINPVWPMPSAAEVLATLRDAGIILGLISNAQFFTRLLFPALLGASLNELGFAEELCWWSYEHRQAKPGAFLYEQARDVLHAQGVAAREVLFVGNDQLKDIWPASRIGFRTALFAGDGRSYRPRHDDPRVLDVQADLMLTRLAELPPCVLSES